MLVAADVDVVFMAGYQKPCGLLNVRGFFDSLLSFIDHSIDERFVRRENRSMVIVSSSPGTLLQLFDRYVPPVVEKWIDDPSTYVESLCQRFYADGVGRPGSAAGPLLSTAADRLLRGLVARGAIAAKIQRAST